MLTNWILVNHLVTRRFFRWFWIFYTTIISAIRAAIITLFVTEFDLSDGSIWGEVWFSVLAGTFFWWAAISAWAVLVDKVNVFTAIFSFVGKALKWAANPSSWLSIPMEYIRAVLIVVIIWTTHLETLGVLAGIGIGLWWKLSVLRKLLELHGYKNKRSSPPLPERRDLESSIHKDVDSPRESDIIEEKPDENVGVVSGWTQFYSQKTLLVLAIGIY